VRCFVVQLLIVFVVARLLLFCYVVTPCIAVVTRYTLLRFASRCLRFTDCGLDLRVVTRVVLRCFVVVVVVVVLLLR